MELYQLQYFVTLVEQPTYTEAARQLHISQPSLSVAIKKLEKELGMPLIDRTTRKSLLTKEGNALYHEAKNLLNHYRYVEKEMQRLKNAGPLELSIGLIESSKFWAPKVVKEFKKEYENVRIKIWDVLSLDEVIRALGNFDIHLAITNQFVEEPSIEMIPIYEEKLVTLLPPQHPLMDREEISIHELEEEPFIVCKEGYQTRADILHAFLKAGVTPDIQVEIEKFETACSMVEEGIGITVVPENYATYSSIPNKQIKTLSDSDISRTVYLAYMKNRYLPPLVHRFMKLIENFFD